MQPDNHRENGEQTCLIVWGDNPDQFIVLDDSRHAVNLGEMR